MTVPSSRPNRDSSEGFAGTTVVRRTPLPKSTLILILVTPDIQQDTGHGVVAVEMQWEIGVKRCGLRLDLEQSVQRLDTVC